MERAIRVSGTQISWSTNLQLYVDHPCRGLAVIVRFKWMYAVGSMLFSLP